MIGNYWPNFQVTPLIGKEVSSEGLEMKQPSLITYGSSILWTEKNKIETWVLDDSVGEVYERKTNFNFA